MKKKILAAVILASMAVAAVAGATPMTEFSKGTAQVDIAGWQHGSKGDGVETKSKIGLAGTATYGLTDKIGVQYSYHDLTTGDFKSDRTAHLGGYQHEVNALYSFAPNAAAYVGWNNVHFNVGSDSNTTNLAQVGVVAKTPLMDKLDLYGNFALGTKSMLMGEAGLGYAITDKLDANFGYRYLKLKPDDTKVTTKGFFMGASMKL